MQVVVEIRAGADDEVHHPALHQLDDAPAQTGRGHCAGDRERDRRIVLGQKHLIGEYATGFTEARGVERLKPFVYQMPDIGAAAGAVIADGFAAQMMLARPVGSARGSVGHASGSLHRTSDPAVSHPTYGAADGRRHRGKLAWPRRALPARHLMRQCRPTDKQIDSSTQ